MLSRRDFLKYCGISAAAIGLSATDLLKLEEVLANPSGPTVLWLHGSTCTGCSVSFLNRISTAAPKTAAEVLVSSVNLAYHPTLMAAAGESAVAVLEQAYAKGGYILAVEGGVPTAFGGNTCWAYTKNGEDVTFQKAVTDLSSRAAKILSIGTCASWGGMSAAYPNPTGVKGVSAATGKPTVNIAGCPTHPDWIAWTVVQLLLGKAITLDDWGRPTALYGKSVHGQCPRRGTEPAQTFGVEGRCMKEMGCQGPRGRANCPLIGWNNKANWCVGANSLCIACTEPTFPKGPFQKRT